ncbi:MAG: hypothetical protein DI585_06795 [Pseudomonas fluorescens]|nr:MAG: hypothetical protein DI585_06795 [Pseudomonas fluorescens]
MAPRKPVAKPAKPAAKPIAQKAAKLTVWPKDEPPHAHTHHHDHAHSEGCGCSHHHHTHKLNLCACARALCTNCPLGKLLSTRSFWAAAVVAFITLFATDWLLHSRFLMQAYAEHAAFWRIDGEIRHGLIFTTQVVTSMAYAAIVLGMGYAGKWWGSAISGAIAAAPVAMCAMMAYIMLPFASAYIPTVWGIAAVLQGALVGLSICAALKVSRAPEVTDESCCSTHTLH